MKEPNLSPDEQSQAISELQNALRMISKTNSDVCCVSVDGIYSLDTKLAVQAFQKANGLEETGETDYITWSAIVQEAERIRSTYAPAQPLSVFQPPQLIIKSGDTGDTVLIIQIMLCSVLNYLQHVETLKIDGIYGSKTINAVKKIQRIADIEQTGSVDKATWNTLADLYSHIHCR